ncbi:hypothetical protein [Sphingobium sp. Cam5-1]|uniref:hypothetical protein n=1 Tax=Sphingobium sp. Cam5-1 TaxID=2789327 RepID=UPI002FE70D49
MVEGGRRDPPLDREQRDQMIETQRSRGSTVIFAIVAIALILAIGFFYLTKERENRVGDTLIEAADSPDSAAHVIGDAAQNEAARLNNRN